MAWPFNFDVVMTRKYWKLAESCGTELCGKNIVVHLAIKGLPGLRSRGGQVIVS